MGLKSDFSKFRGPAKKFENSIRAQTSIDLIRRNTSKERTFALIL